MTHLTRKVVDNDSRHVHDGGANHHAHAHDAAHHDHSGGIRHKLRHLFGELTGNHSHDTADQVDKAMESDAEGTHALFVSLGVLLATAAIQAVVVSLSGSIALLGDTLHNIADALTAVPLLVAFALALRPANKRYTYGYGRIEDVAGLFVIAMILLSSIAAGYEAIMRLINPHSVSHLWAVAAAAIVGFAGNEIVARYRIRVGRKIGSAALVADGLHARTDGFTSLAVLFGAAGVALGWAWADPVIGLLITVAIIGVLRSAVRQVGARLLDAVDPQLVDDAMASVSSVEDVSGIRELKLRWIGHTIRAEVDVTVDPSLTVGEAHAIAHHAEDHLLLDVPRLTAANVHASPAGAHESTGEKRGRAPSKVQIFQRFRSQRGC